MGDDGVTDDYIDELTGLAEPTSELMFASSGATLAIEVNELNRVGNSISVLIWSPVYWVWPMVLTSPNPSLGWCVRMNLSSALPKTRLMNRLFSTGMYLMMRVSR